MIATVRGVFVSAAVEFYIVAIAQATREDPELRLGASPRATLQLMRAAKARAALDGREFVLPDDVNALAGAVLGHRVVASARSMGNGPASSSTVRDIIARIVDETPVPLGPTGND